MCVRGMHAGAPPTAKPPPQQMAPSSFVCSATVYLAMCRKYNEPVAIKVRGRASRPTVMVHWCGAMQLPASCDGPCSLFHPLLPPFHA